ncbi:MAG: glycosyltransferase family 10 domain-containing protein [Candidatus Humimicrobiaceae bacterium]
MSPFISLGKYLKALGHSFNTIDVEQNLFKFDAIVFIEFPMFKNTYFRKLVKNNYKNLYLILNEPEIINKENWRIANHKYFKKIFTFRDDIIDNKKYFKINYCIKKPENLDFDILEKKKLCTMIAGNKYIKYPDELYTKRLKAIRWFEDNHLNDFDLYGYGWNKFIFTNKFHFLNNLKIFKYLFKSKFPSYRGSTKSKIETLKNYKFSICFENIKDIPGYISEKILDCFISGCVPIYLGAPNISDHIPENTFIDMRNFNNYDDLYFYIKNMSNNEYLNYLNNIKSFFNSKNFNYFSFEYFANKIITEIIKS